MTEVCYTDLPLYVSSLTGKPLTLDDARIGVLGRGEIASGGDFRGEIRRADMNNASERHAVEAINKFFWDSMEQTVFRRSYKIAECENYLAVPDDESECGPNAHGIAGHMALFNEDDFLHVVVFHVWPQWHRRGVGYRMIVTAIDEAKRRDYDTIKLGTTNDNIPALYFYQRVGFAIDEIVAGEWNEGEDGRTFGFAGIRITKDIHMKLDLKEASGTGR